MSSVLVKVLTRWRRQAIKITQSLSRETTRSTRWELSEILQSMSKKQTDTYQGYTIWLHGRITRKKKTPGNLPRQLCTSGRWSAPSMGTTRRSQQQHQHPWTLLRPWPSQQSSSPQSESEGDRQDALRRRAKWSNKEEVTRRNLSQCDPRARSQWVAGDLFSWRKERRRACSGSLTISSLTLEELHSTLFWPSPSSSKSLLEQTPLLSTNLGLSFPVLSPGWKVFLLTISIPYDLCVFLPSLPHWLGDFSLINSMSGFPPQSCYHLVGRFFTSDIIHL